VTIIEYDQLLARVTYKPGWHFALHPASGGFVWLEVQCPVIDSVLSNLGMTIALSYAFNVEEWVSEARFFAFVRDCVKRTEEHELNEFFRVDNRGWPCELHATF
jgi:hypothetical protein